jgi:hypothetical protein
MPPHPIPQFRVTGAAVFKGMTMKCQFMTSQISTEPFGAARAHTMCITHNWPLEYPASTETLCPIGRIEQARDQAIALIHAERSK